MIDFRALPKTELHCHLDGSLRPHTLLDLAGEHSVVLPGGDLPSLKRALRAGEVREDLQSYLDAFALTLSVLTTEAAIARVAEELVVDCAADGVIRLEARFSPLLHPLPLERSTEAALRGLARGAQKTGVSVGLILCAIRSLPATESLRLAEVAATFAGGGVCGFDLAGAEAGYPAAPHQAAFDRAHTAGLGITVHAGEAEGAWSVREAVRAQHARRVGHGTHITEDPALMDAVRDADIALEVCLQSNVETRCVSALYTHPFATLLRAGLRVTLNTDNRLMSDIDLSGEYKRATHAFSLSPRELKQICRNGVAAAFVAADTRAALSAKVDTFSFSER